MDTAARNVPGGCDRRTACIVPDLIAELEKPAHPAWLAHALGTPQMGRTHGQHAVPMTFGFAVALYVSRVGQRIESIIQAATNLRGKFAGAVGAYNALSLLSPEPAEIEAALMKKPGFDGARRFRRR